MFNMKWLCLLTVVLIWLGGNNLASGCSGCHEDYCTAADIERQTAYMEWQAAIEAYETALSNGADQQTLDQLDAERMQADVNHQNAEETKRAICG